MAKDEEIMDSVAFGEVFVSGVFQEETLGGDGKGSFLLGQEDGVRGIVLESNGEPG
jgi:hypothetical protein